MTSTDRDLEGHARRISDAWVARHPGEKVVDLHCSKCGGTVRRKAASVPVRCPLCKRTKWVTEG